MGKGGRANKSDKNASSDVFGTLTEGETHMSSDSLTVCCHCPPSVELLT